ncbi:nucleotide-sugar transporter-domain-containing protein [Coprinopsis sp. MPI-PUGE-AT-0042]|nr:nucleotide-sugar transporter-domain-containing protein [Coprinopsis sp. MPI-PUGE-AT-0042]
MHHRPVPTVRPSISRSKPSPILPSSSTTYHSEKKTANSAPYSPQLDAQAVPSICGMPLKYVSLVTLAVQNAALAIVMHYSRISIPPELAYSPASAVLLNEILKGSISFSIAVYNASRPPSSQYSDISTSTRRHSKPLVPVVREVCKEILSPDCWKLSIPAILYVVQNTLQFVAISNLPVATFQVTYQMKILTTAAFSVILLRKKLSGAKWLSLLLLALGVGIVQIQTQTSSTSGPSKQHEMDTMKGFMAVAVACMTSGLAGVYFEMVLKGSKADLWVRNVQLSLFSLVPALLPIIPTLFAPTSASPLAEIFKNFGFWAWATVLIQVLGGLITAVVIKYSDNIMKGFATSLAIVLSFLASVVLFEFEITLAFVAGAGVVLGATWMYNQPESKEGGATVPVVLVKPLVESPLLGEREGDVESSGNEYGQKALRRSSRDTRPDL